MALEAATYIADLNSANPTATDGLAQGDDHIRLIKSAVKATFPNITNAGPVTATAEQLNGLSGLTGLMGWFVVPTTDPLWLRLNGGTFAYTDHPALGTALGFSSGTCTLPNLEDTGRFVRAITTGLTAGQSQANALKSHFHTGAGTVTATGTAASGGVDHTHTFSGVTGGQNVAPTVTLPIYATSGTAGAQTASTNSGSLSNNITLSVTDHTHNFSGTTSNSSTYLHTHPVSVAGTCAFTTDAAGDTETRPEAYVAIPYVHV